MMTSTQNTALHIPFPRNSVLDVAPLYAQLRKDTPVVAVTTPTGDPAWVVVAYAEAKQAFSDKRFGYYTHEDLSKASRMSEAAMHSAPMGGVDFELEMGRLRRLMVPAFSPKRLKLLADWIQKLTDECLDDMQAEHDRHPGQPVNFHEKLGFRLPVLVIGALLGLPSEDSDYVIGLSHRMGSTTNGTDAFAAMGELQAYMGRLVAVKRNNLGQDVISDMIRAQQDDPGFFTTFPVEYYAAGLVFPGHETTVVRMDFGVLYLLNNLQHRDWLMADPDNRIDQTVEEIARVVSAHNFGLMRYAMEDVDLGGVTIRRGDLVIIAEAAANRDPTVFDRPEEFDPTRQPQSHLAFGHGSHSCIGQALARMEVKTVLLSLFRRFPNVRLAGDIGALRIDNTRLGGGVDDVPLIW